MLYFTLLYLISFIYWGPKLSRRNKIIFAALPFIIINFIRFGYGADYFSYGRIYNELNVSGVYQSIMSNTGIEPIYTLLNYISRTIGLNYHLFAGLFTSAIVIITIYWLVDYSPQFEWSVLLYYAMHYSVWTLSALRQGFTMALLFYFLFNNRKHFKKSIIVAAIIFALGIHSASIILVGLYLVSSLKWERKYFLYILALVPVARLILRPDILVLFEKLPAAGKVVRLLLKYLGDTPISLFGFTSLVRIFFMIVVWLHYNKLREEYPDYTKVFNFVILSFLLYLFIPFSTVIATRVTVYGYFLTIIVFPMIMRLYSETQYKTIMVAGLMGFSLLSFYNEFDKMTDRSGYEAGLTKLNFETIFNPDYRDFNRQFALHNQIDDVNSKKYQDDAVMEKVLSKEVSVNASFTDTESYYSVRYSNIPGYAVIDSQGKLVSKPRLVDSLSVVGNLVEYTTSNSGAYTYPQYNPIGSIIGVSEDVIREQIANNATSSIERNSTPILKRRIELSWLEESEIFTDYTLKPVEVAYLHSDTYMDKYQYLEIRTSYRSYYALLDSEGQVVSNTWYNRIIPQDASGLIVAYTSYGKEYINREGQVFWIDPIR